ncbi:MAG: signal transduction histidine kinase regulating citrate/malate metabolism [Anaerosolibacter sp.]|jgi:PAS domain S-box-containing protein|uniref:DcuS/MalK family sensor histidine kinase n=1 Tax=Anaerosolibacter sp. TaxID=1872527 RepID=UPI00260F10B7|nr:DcuS/MalK family sensor histidine kinase [Anaerosolibacter sp.]MDF2548193.1 signal transduction histidine kinase regulating citrate/malate metabolism [Anaerosolibacter sp.]
MGKVHLNLQTKIIILTFIIIFMSVTITVSFTSRWVIGNVQDEIETNIMNVAQLVAATPIVINGLSSKTQGNEIQEYVEKVLANTEKVEIIVVADMTGIRYGHPSRDRLGKKFVGGDEQEVLTKGNSYISEATGTMGRAVRAFTPIIDSKGNQVGFAMAGALTQTVHQVKKQSILTLILSSGIGLLIGAEGAFLLARNIKKSLLGLEPEEILKLYIEKKGMLDAIHEGIIAIDEHSNITLVNDSAIKLLQIQQENIVGKNIMDIFPTSRLPEVVKTGVAEYDREQVLNETIIITNRIPIRDGDKSVGAIATFRDKTMITQLAEEVTGIKQIVDALRANTHEFMNKMHVILGLIQVGEYEEAKRYIISETERQQQIISLVMNKVKDPTVAGLILGKFSRAKELGIDMKIDLESSLEKRIDRVHSNTLVTIIGNLLENAMEAVQKSHKTEKFVKIKLKESENEIIIQVKDNGTGIPRENQAFIFNRGFTTNEGSRGIGLALIKETIDNLGGQIEVSSDYGKETKFKITIPKEGQS